MTSRSDITLAVLAGGESSRMGRPKAQLLITDRPILEFLLDRLAWKGPALLVTAPGKQRPPGWERFDREVVDPVSGQGPLRGILTAIENATTSRVIAIPLDMPMILPQHLSHLCDEFDQHPEQLALIPSPRPPTAPRPPSRARIIEPFPSIFHTRAREILQRRLDAHQLAVHHLLDEPGFGRIDVDWEPQTWLNLNHPRDLQLLSRHGLTVA